MRIRAKLKAHGQEHLLAYYDELNKEEQKKLLEQIEEIDWDTLALWNREKPRAGKITPIEVMKREEIERRREEFFALGSKKVKEGKVAAVLLAGGMGTRLGLTGPKGAFDIGVDKHLYIFECLIHNLQKNCSACGGVVPLYVMTSELNDEKTRAFFREHDYFGYPEKAIAFFKQEMSPCVDENGKVLLEGKGKIAVSPNGNGGWYSSLHRAGLLKDAKKRGVEWFNVFAVDNVLQNIADPVFVGAAMQSNMGTAAKVVRKSCPEEKVGVLSFVDGLPGVIEYYELGEELAAKRDENGDLVYSSGVILNYLFRADKLEKVAKEKIPVHVVKKKIPYLNEEGELVKPQTENGYKFETLILDMIRLVGSCLPFEVEREKEFAPVKNAQGVDSVETARELLKKNGIEI